MSALIDPIPRINEWLHTYLGSDPTLAGFATGGIWRGHAPQGKVPPYIVYSYLGDANQVRGNGPIISLWVCRYLVKVVQTGNSQASAQSINDRILQLLHTARGGVSGLEIVSAIWKKPVNYEETGQETGAQSVIATFQHLGAEYEISVRPT